MRRWVWNCLIALDQGVNALLGGHPDETITSRAHKARGRGRRWGRALCGVLDRLDPDHCTRGLEPDEGDPT